MPEDIKILSARRSYEFATDDLRLTLLSSQAVIDHIKSAFGFHLGTVATPMETFGTVPGTIPPGLVFNYGVAPYPEDQGTAIRWIHFEQRRIVIDVAGPSDAIGPTFQALRSMFDEVKAADGSPAIGEPTATLDYSEITFRLPVPPEFLVSAPLRPLLRRYLSQFDQKNSVLVPSLGAQLLLPDEEFPGSTPRTPRSAYVEIRAGTTAGSPTFFSAAPQDTTEHLKLIDEIAVALAQ